MFPVLLKFPEFWYLIGGKAIHTYGLLYALGFLAGLYWVRYESRRLGMNVDRMVDLFFYIVVSSVVGARLLYVFASVKSWWQDPLVFLRIWEGGLVFYGGLILAILVGILYCRRHGLSPIQVLDIYTPGIALGHGIGRLGCFAAGCCYGKPAEVNTMFTVIFPDSEYAIAPPGRLLYATQLFEAVAELAIFLVLFWFRKKKRFDGEIFLIYIILYPIVRSIVEIYRGDKIRGFVVDNVLSTSQFISILWVVVAIILWATVLRRKRT